MDAGVSGFPPTAPPAADWPHRRTPWWNTTEARSDALAVRVQGLGEVARADDKVTCEVFPVEARRAQVSPDADAVDALNLGSDRAADIRKHLAASCYAEGRLSLGRATRLSGLGYADFLANLRQRQIPLDHGPDDLRDARVMRRKFASCTCGVLVRRPLASRGSARQASTQSFQVAVVPAHPGILAPPPDPCSGRTLAVHRRARRVRPCRSANDGVKRPSAAWRGGAIYWRWIAAGFNPGRLNRGACGQGGQDPSPAQAHVCSPWVGLPARGRPSVASLCCNTAAGTSPPAPRRARPSQPGPASPRHVLRRLHPRRRGPGVRQP